MIDKQAKVTVVIPCYNDGKYINEAVDSILAQTYQDFEILIVNDGSTDEYTNNLLSSYSKPKTKVLFKDNGHLSSARNHGIKHAKSEYILPFDADDIFEPSYLEKAVKILDENFEIGVVTCDIRLFENAKGIWRSKSGDVMDLLAKNDICGNSLFRYQCWIDAGGYNENMRGFEDWDFWIGVGKKGWKFYSIPEVLFNYRITNKSMYQNVLQKGPELTKQIVENHLEFYREHFVAVIYEKHKLLLQMEARMRQQEEKLKNKIQAVENSKAYKIGSWIIAPFKRIYSFLSFLKK
ncbi:MAG: glycosyltransferase family 2 protein [Bacteroidota bacterium]|nr:glycosyltransferase family 2 protein [Bacteroidota bacterium]